MKVAITGGNGFIGRRLLEFLIQRNYDISVLSRRTNHIFSSDVHVVKGDLTLEDCPFDELLDGCEVVFNCAGEIRDKTAMRLLHVDGTKRLLQAVTRTATQRGRPIHWVQLSSVGVYGPPREAANAERIVTEDTQVRPLGEYETTKTKSDEMLIEASKNGMITYSIVRPSNVFGVNMPNKSLRSLGATVRNGMFFYVGKPGAVATYIHVDDVVEVLERCGVDPRAKGKIFNVSNDCSLEEMVKGIASAYGVVSPWIRLPELVVRGATFVVSRIISIPLTQERINALVSRTRYPHLKLERELGFIPQKPVSKLFNEVMVTE